MHIGASIGRTALPSQITAFDRYARQIEEVGLDAVEIDFSIRGHFPEFAPLPNPARRHAGLVAIAPASRQVGDCRRPPALRGHEPTLGRPGHR